MNENTGTATLSPTTAVGQMFHTAPRVMGTLFAAIAAVVVGTGISQLF
jgi:hypothetical protein